jgi:hypothetical protein
MSLYRNIEAHLWTMTIWNRFCSNCVYSRLLRAPWSWLARLTGVHMQRWGRKDRRLGKPSGILVL